MYILFGLHKVLVTRKRWDNVVSSNGLCILVHLNKLQGDISELIMGGFLQEVSQGNSHSVKEFLENGQAGSAQC